jgi:hypothetical protein
LFFSSKTIGGMQHQAAADKSNGRREAEDDGERGRRDEESNT